ncbi:MAG: LptF/LptG family permease [Cyclobacteriaceae bacterium]
MKKLDKLILSSFLGQFFLTFIVVVFILLLQFMLKYFDELVGKDLGWEVYLQLIFYFSINMTTNAFPLAVLLSSLMTFGSLGEHSELTAVKSAGISLTRTMFPIFFFSVILTVVAFYNNNYIVPKANLEAFTLLYDIKQKKPSMELKEGSFYNGIPGFSIKVNKKFPDDVSLKELIIYNHTAGNGNKQVILADSGRMYNMLDGRYLVFELFNGNRYSEEPPNRARANVHTMPAPYFRSTFDKTKMVFSLADFDMKRTRKELFQSNRLMKNIKQLRFDIDSMKTVYAANEADVRRNTVQIFNYHIGDITGKDSIRRKSNPVPRPIKSIEEKKLNLSDSVIISDKSRLQTANTKPDRLRQRSLKELPPTDSLALNAKDKAQLTDSVALDTLKLTAFLDSLLLNDSLFRVYYDSSGDSLLIADSLAIVLMTDTLPPPLEPWEKVDSVINSPELRAGAYRQALSQVRYVGNNMTVTSDQLERLQREINLNEIERYKKFSYACTILIMFFIGAPLGAIIKKGGLGLPVLLSIFFFILFYVISMSAEKWARQGLVNNIFAVWLANLILLPIGFVFTKGARNDARLFEADLYHVLWMNFKNKLQQFKAKVFSPKR